VILKVLGKPPTPVTPHPEGEKMRRTAEQVFGKKFGVGIEENSCIKDTVEMVLDWADDHPRFDASFIESLKEQLENKGYLSEKQIMALENIIERFNIDQ
jgi:hypothetical protein